MSILKRLRGEPGSTMPFLGQVLTFYRHGVQLGLVIGLATFVIFNLPWNLFPAGGQIFRGLTAVVGCYLAAAMMASRAPAEIDLEDAAARWL